MDEGSGDLFPVSQVAPVINAKPKKKLTLVVDKTRFICNAAIFNQQPNTLLGKMFSPQFMNQRGTRID